VGSDIRSIYFTWCGRGANIFRIGVSMRKTKYIQTGDDHLFDETLELEDEFDLEEFENDPMFDPNDHEYLQELNNEKAKDGQPLPLDRYFNRFRKNRQSN
jgi:hypothetical protein